MVSRSRTIFYVWRNGNCCIISRVDDGQADHSPRAAGKGSGRPRERGGYYPSCIRVRPGQVIVPKVHSGGDFPTTPTDSPYTFPSRRRTPQSAGTSCNIWAIGRDQSAWDGAITVIPERFLNDEATDFKGKHFDLVPFGSGRRWCPGMQLGLPYHRVGGGPAGPLLLMVITGGVESVGDGHD